MAKKDPSVAPRIYIIKTEQNFHVVPPTSFAAPKTPSNPDFFEFKNLTTQEATVHQINAASQTVFAQDYLVPKNGGVVAAALAPLTDGVYEYTVTVGPYHQLAIGGSAPRIIIDG